MGLDAEKVIFPVKIICRRSSYSKRKGTFPRQARNGCSVGLRLPLKRLSILPAGLSELGQSCRRFLQRLSAHRYVEFVHRFAVVADKSLGHSRGNAGFCRTGCRPISLLAREASGPQLRPQWPYFSRAARNIRSGSYSSGSDPRNNKTLRRKRLTSVR